MAIEFTKQETEPITHSIQKFFRDEWDEELSDMRARFLLDFFLKEIGPFAYNQGVKDAESYLRGKVEDLTAVCFEEPLTYWTKRKK
jgi:uncharacterized protein (DUF2164 family)